MSLVSELKRRNVFRVAAAYLVVGWLLTEVLTTILPALGAPEWQARAVIFLFVFGFVPVVVLSWIYELTPEGIKKEADVDRDNGHGRNAISKLDYITITGVALAIIFVAFISARQSPENSTVSGTAVSDVSVAVLPFVNMSNDEDNEYFSDGLTETLLHMLSQNPGLKVAARTSSFAFKGKNMDIRQIADALQVAHILEGSVQQAGNRVRVTAQLIRADDGFHVWSESYDRTIDNIFAIQDEIAAKVGGELSASLLGAGTPVAGVGTDSPDAYDLYLQALKEQKTYSYGGFKAAAELLKGALTVDPDFLDAKTELASNYLHQSESGLMDEKDAFAAVLAITNQVLFVRPYDANARAIQIYAQAIPHFLDRNADAIFDAIRQLEDLNAEYPDKNEGRILLTRLLRDLKQFERALALQLGALQRDPFNARILYEVGSLYLELGQRNDARTVLQKSLDIEPLAPNGYLQLAVAALQEGDGVGFLARQLKAMEVDPRDHEIPAQIAGFLYEFGLLEEGDEFRDRVVAIAPTSAIAHRIALERAISSGDEEASMAAARQAIEDDIEDRQFSYGGAVQYLMRVAAKNGTVEEESTYLESHAPGIFDIDAALTPAKYRIAQKAAIDAWYKTMPREKLLGRIEKMAGIESAFGLNSLQDPRVRVSVLAMRGNTLQAIQVALSDVFTQPVTMNSGWRNDFAQAQFENFVEDPRIQDAMQEWENEEAALRRRLELFLGELSSVS